MTRSRITLLVLGACLLFSQIVLADDEDPGLAPGPIFQCKMTWEMGKLHVAGSAHTITYKDAHLEIWTRGIVQMTDPNYPIGTADGNFSEPNIVHGEVLANEYIHDTLTIDWEVPDANHPVEGNQTIGLEFALEAITMNSNTSRPIVKKSTLTGASVSSPLVTFTNETVPVRAPVTSGWKKVNPVSWIFSLDDPNMQTPTTFQNVKFYRTANEPALSDMTSANFPSLSKVHLHDEADFTLDPINGPNSLTVSGLTADLGDWVICNYKTTWDDPVWTSIAGQKVSLDATVWVAGEVIPEPASLGLLAVGGLAILRRRRRQ